jgi:apolipoprotein N-acyltransferase
MAEQAQSKTDPIIALIAITLSATAFFFGNGLHPHWWLLWLAPIPVLMAASRLTARSAWMTAFIAFFLGGSTWWSYFQILELPIGVRLLAFLGPPLVFTFAVMTTRALLLRGCRWASALALPTIWVSFDYLQSVGRNGTALNLSYSQMNFLPVLQVASVTGIWGIEFVVLFFGSAVAVAIAKRKQRGPKYFIAACMAVVAGVLAFGAARLAQSQTGEQVTIGLTSSDQRPLLAKDEAGSAPIIAAYSQSIDQLAAKGAKIVLIPEKIGPVFNQASGPTLDTLSEAAKRNNVIVAAGVDQPDQPLKHNLAFVFGPDGSQQLVYEKHFMVPGWEDGYERGTQIATFPAPHSNWGVVICKDMDFPTLSRQYAEHGVQLMFAPAWDFTIDDWLHGRMAVLRGVESGFAIARSAKQGLMTISDNRGRILAQGHSAESSPATLWATVTVSQERTLYSRWGDWFAWLNVAAVAALIFLRVRKRNRVKSSAA